MKKTMNVAVQTYNKKINCLSCSDYINHPICHECLVKEFNEWTKRYPMLKKRVSKEIDKFVSKTKKYKGERCVICKNDIIHTCPYCFTEYLYSLLKQAGAGITTMTEFLFMFNFDFEKKGYSRELEIFGGY